MLGTDLARPFRGVRASHTAVASLYGLCRAYEVRMRSTDFFCGLTAARIWRIPLPEEFLPGEGLHVGTHAPSRAPRGAGLTGRQFSDDRLRLVERFGFRVADAASTWCHLAGELRHDDLVAAGDHLVLVPKKQDPHDIRPYATFEELSARVGAYSGRHARAARRALLEIRQGAESRPESILRLTLVRGGLPEPDLNLDITDARGRWLGRADLVYRRFKVIVEYDGELHRTNSAQYDKDMMRIEEFARAGWTVIRIRKRALFGDPGSVVARAESALRDNGWRP
jgi:hypothetical protein